MSPEVPHQGGVVVSLESIYTLALETRTIVDRIDTANKDTSKNLSDHEDRIRSLEQARWKIVGGAGAVGFVAGLIPTVIAIFSR